MLNKKGSICFLILLFSFLQGQDVVDYKNVTNKPVFPGCEGFEGKTLDHCNSKITQIELVRYLTYPEKAIEENRSGTAYIKFIVSEDGKIEKPKILRSSKYEDLDSASIRAVSLLFHDKQVIPGKLNNVPVKVFYQVPVKFKLEENSNNQVKLTSEEILNRLEKMKSPDFDNPEAKIFSDNYVKFVKGIIIGFYLKDRRVIDDWEEFFKEHDLNEIPDHTKLTARDKINLGNLLGEINYIKHSIN